MPLLLAIIRHGKADQHSPTGLDDHRALLPKGRRQAEYLAAALPAHLRGPVHLISSPIVRARETAATIAAALKLPLHFDDRLATGRSARDAIEVIEEAHAEHAPASIVIVGHNPHFEALCHDLLDPKQLKDAAPNGFTGELKTGAAILLDIHTPLQRKSARFISHLRLNDEESKV